MAIFSFIEEYDLSGKTIIPFCAHGTGGLAGSVKDITGALPDSAEVLEPIGVYRPDVDSAQPVINEWWISLGLQMRNRQKPELIEQMPMTLPMMDLYGREMCYRYGTYALPTDDLLSDGYEVGDVDVTFELMESIQ